MLYSSSCSYSRSISKLKCSVYWYWKTFFWITKRLNAWDKKYRWTSERGIEPELFSLGLLCVRQTSKSLTVCSDCSPSLQLFYGIRSVFSTDHPQHDVVLRCLHRPKSEITAKWLLPWLCVKTKGKQIKQSNRHTHLDHLLSILRWQTKCLVRANCRWPNPRTVTWTQRLRHVSNANPSYVWPSIA